MANNCGMVGNEQKLTHATTRIAFFDMLSEYKKVDGLGKCRHTAGSTPAGRRHSGLNRISFFISYDHMTEYFTNLILLLNDYFGGRKLLGFRS